MTRPLYHLDCPEGRYPHLNAATWNLQLQLLQRVADRHGHRRAGGALAIGVPPQNSGPPILRINTAAGRHLPIVPEADNRVRGGTPISASAPHCGMLSSVRRRTQP